MTSASQGRHTVAPQPRRGSSAMEAMAPDRLGRRVRVAGAAADVSAARSPVSTVDAHRMAALTPATTRLLTGGVGVVECNPRSDWAGERIDAKLKLRANGRNDQMTAAFFAENEASSMTSNTCSNSLIIARCCSLRHTRRSWGSWNGSTSA